MGSPLLPRTRRVPRAMDPRTQILALGCADRQRLRRSKSFLLLPADRRIRIVVSDAGRQESQAAEYLLGARRRPMKIARRDWKSSLDQTGRSLQQESRRKSITLRAGA